MIAPRENAMSLFYLFLLSDFTQIRLVSPEDSLFSDELVNSKKAIKQKHLRKILDVNTVSISTESLMRFLDLDGFCLFAAKYFHNNKVKVVTNGC